MRCFNLARLSTTSLAGSINRATCIRLFSTPPPITTLFIEMGFGNDSHGQNVTKAAVRACRNAIEFNSIPSIAKIVPGGYDKMKLTVDLAIPPKYKHALDEEACKKVFPYGAVTIRVQDGGGVFPSGIAIDALGDKNEDMVVAIASVSVGY